MNQGTSDVITIGLMVIYAGIFAGFGWTAKHVRLERLHRTIQANQANQIDNQEHMVENLKDRLRQNRQDVVLIKQQSHTAFTAGYQSGLEAGREQALADLAVDRERHANVIDITDRMTAERQSRAKHPANRSRHV